MGIFMTKFNHSM